MSMVTVLSRPIGHKLNISGVSGLLLDSGTGDALIYTGAAHGLSDGDYVYIQSNFNSYKGYRQVDSVSYDTFKILNDDGSTIEFKQGEQLSYYVAVLNHGWQCVHLPIVYDLKSDLWPHNIAEDAYTPVVITSQSNYGGYTELHLSRNIDNFETLDFIKLVQDGGVLQGAYQITNKIHESDIVINLVYDSMNNFSGYAVQNYYNNYYIGVEVWAGFNMDHRWFAEKPYRLASTLKFIPDSDGTCKFSISEILKSYINIVNDTTLDTLPNNIDFNTGFYIKYFEAYDRSDGTDIRSFSTTRIQDSFEGNALNAMLPFKSLDAGFMCDYVNEPVSGYLASWLTIQSRPQAFVGRYFDLSFINPVEGGVDLTILVNGLTYLTILNPGTGIIRVPFEFTSSGQKCVQALSVFKPGIGPPPDPVLQPLASWVNGPNPFEWSLGAAPNTSVNGSGGTVNYIVGTFAAVAGMDHMLSITTGLVGSGSVNFNLHVALLDALYGELDSIDFIYGANGSHTETDFILNPTANATYLGVKATNNTPFFTEVITINAVSFAGFMGGGSTPEIPAQTITEVICIDVLDDCDITFVDDDLRITEDVILRRI